MEILYWLSTQMTINSQPMPDLIKFLAEQWAVGAGVSTLFDVSLIIVRQLKWNTRKEGGP
jgi:hypothetical protein